MKRLYLDSSIFLSALLKDNFVEKAERILNMVGLGKCNGFTTTFTINEILFTLRNKGMTTDEMRKAIDFVTQHPNIFFFNHGINTYYEALKYKDRGLDIGDSLHVGAMKEFGISEIASFDSDFDKIKEIKRISSL